MAHVRVPGVWRHVTNDIEVVPVKGETVKDALIDLVTVYPVLHDRLFLKGDYNSPNKHVIVCLNDADIRFAGGLQQPLADGDMISLVPAFAGG